MSPAPRKRPSKPAAKPDELEGKTPQTAEDATAKPKRARKTAEDVAAKPKRARKTAEDVAAKPKRARKRPTTAKAPAGAPDAAAPGAEPAPEPVKTQGDKATEQELVPAADQPAAEEAATAAPSRSRLARRAKADEKPAEPAPKPVRDPDRTSSVPPMVRAHAKYVRTSARKARLVCDHIRGKSVDEARAILAHANRDVARDWTKLLESAVANAEHNHELVGDELRIHAVKADEGPTLKRFRPRAMGRATPIRKRTSHLSITLTPKDGE
jgi:ribosomal protein L22